MFVRRKKNPSGKVSVQVIDKSLGKYKVIRTIGSSSDSQEIERLVEEGKNWIGQKLGQMEFSFSAEKQQAERFLDQIEQVRTLGPELLLGKLYDQIGFNQIPDELLRKLVISRICYPSSKLQTTDYLAKYQFISLSPDQIYRYMDKLHKKHKTTVQQISYQHTQKILAHLIQVVFYDVTTLYFEIDREDDLRKTGFSKDGKHQHPQIVLGLLVSVNGYPLAYEIFQGNQFEGHTMIPVLKEFTEQYSVKQLVVVADSGLLSKKNIAELREEGHTFILGARLKNESQKIREQIEQLSLKNGETHLIAKSEEMKLIITYSDKRAEKDRYNRERGLKRLKKRIQSGKLTKAHINNRGYNKYLKLEGKIKVSIDEQKWEQDAKWDGLKGYLTNTAFSKEEVVEHYQHLWKIEKAFRISKHDLKIRPIYHYLPRRIEAHICIAFLAYKVYKELERQLQEIKAPISPEKAIEIAKTIYGIKLRLTDTQEVIEKILLKTDEQRKLVNWFQL